MARTGGASYVIMTSWGCEVHLTQAGAGPWRVLPLDACLFRQTLYGT
jgi:hypothetical protein